MADHWQEERETLLRQLEEARRHIQRLETEHTARAAVETALGSANSLNQGILEASPVGITVYAADGPCILANNAMAAMLGATREQVMSQNFRHIESWRTSGLLDDAVAVLSGEERPEQDIRVITSFGNDVWIRYQARRFFAAGQPHLLLTVTDITGRKGEEDALRDAHAELELRIRERTRDLEHEITEREQAVAALRESEIQYRAVFEAVTDGLFVLNREGYILDVNPAGCELQGLPREKLLGVHASVFCPPEEQDKFAYFAKCLQEGLYYVDEVTNMTVDRGPVATDVRGVPFAMGGEDRYVLVLRDISDRKESERELAEQQEELLQADKLAALGTLVAGMAHEINNPNSAISLNSTVLEELWQQLQPALDVHRQDLGQVSLGGRPANDVRADVAELLSGIRGASARIERIVTDLRSYARRERRDPPQPLCVNEALHAALNLLKGPLGKSTIQVTVDLADDLPQIRGNFQRMEQVFVNILQNAWQSLTNDAGEIKVTTRFDAGKEEVVVMVEDTGIGIPQDDLRDITDPFFTTKRDIGGTGLGLSVCARIVKEHSGVIAFDSRVDSGTTVTVTLPLQSQTDADHE